MPLEAKKVAEGEPLIRTEKKADDTKASTQLTQELENPKAPSMTLRNFRLILLKALDMSSFKSIPEMQEVLRVWMAS